MEENMNVQEMERRFLGHFVHTLEMDAQIAWLEAQPEIEDALNALGGGEDWITTRLEDALDAVRRARMQRIAEAEERDRVANCFTFAAVLSEAMLPPGVGVQVLPKHMPLDGRLDRPVTLEFVIGGRVFARYAIHPSEGQGKIRAGYKKFVREQLPSRLANLGSFPAIRNGGGRLKPRTPIPLYERISLKEAEKCKRTRRAPSAYRGIGSPAQRSRRDRGRLHHAAQRRERLARRAEPGDGRRGRRHGTVTTPSRPHCNATVFGRSCSP
jgi:hypothetical protein